MSINLRTGQPGHGKSYSAIVEILGALDRGQYVATNVPLTDGWALVMSRSNEVTRLLALLQRLAGRPAEKRVDRRKAARYQSRMYYVEDLTELQRLRLPDCGKCKGCRQGPGCQREGRGLAVLDEAHQWLNSRTWDADETGQAATKAEAVKRRLAIVRFFATHRHRGWNIELLTQDDLNLDRQVRTLFETHTHLKNLKRFKLLGLVPIVPFNCFVAVTTWHDADKTRLGVRTYMLNKRLARCYDTFGAGRNLGEDADPDAIYLGNLIVNEHLGRLDPTPVDALVGEPADGDRPAVPSEAGDGRTESVGDSPRVPRQQRRKTPKLPRSIEPSEVNGNIAQMPLNEATPGVHAPRAASNLRVVTAPDAAPQE